MEGVGGLGRNIDIQPLNCQWSHHLGHEEKNMVKCLEAFVKQDNMQIYIRKVLSFHVGQIKLCHRWVILLDESLGRWTITSMECGSLGPGVYETFFFHLLLSLSLPGPLQFDLNSSWKKKVSFARIFFLCCSQQSVSWIAVIKDRSCFSSSSGLWGSWSFPWG